MPDFIYSLNSSTIRPTPILEKIAAKDGSDEVRAAAKDALDKMKGIATPGQGDVTSPTFVEDPDKLGKEPAKPSKTSPPE